MPGTPTATAHGAVLQSGTPSRDVTIPFFCGLPSRIRPRGSGVNPFPTPAPEHTNGDTRMDDVPAHSVVPSPGIKQRLISNGPPTKIRRQKPGRLLQRQSERRATRSPSNSKDRQPTTTYLGRGETCSAISAFFWSSRWQLSLCGGWSSATLVPTMQMIGTAGTDGFDRMLDNAETVGHAMRRKRHCKS